MKKSFIVPFRGGTSVLFKTYCSSTNDCLQSIYISVSNLKHNNYLVTTLKTLKAVDRKPYRHVCACGRLLPPGTVPTACLLGLGSGKPAPGWWGGGTAPMDSPAGSV